MYILENNFYFFYIVLVRKNFKLQIQLVVGPYLVLRKYFFYNIVLDFSSNLVCRTST